jgi:signal transduction histidine kinase
LATARGAATGEQDHGREGPRGGVAERSGESERISQGLADVLVHRLFAVGLDLHAALTYIEADIADEVTIDKIHKAIGGLDSAIRDFRGVVFDLHPGSGEPAGLRGLIVAAVERACAPDGRCPTLTLGDGMETMIDQPSWQRMARLVHRALTLIPRGRLSAAHVMVAVDPRPPKRLVMDIDGPVADLAGVAGRLRTLEALDRQESGHWRDLDVSCQTIDSRPEQARIRLAWPVAPR